MTNWIDRTIEEVTAAVDRVMGKYAPSQRQTASSEDGHLPAEIKVISGPYDEPDDTCTLLPATISLIRAADGTLASVDETTYSMAANSGSSFQITGCQYHYNLAASVLGVGTYRVDISINGIMVGHAVFTLK